MARSHLSGLALGALYSGSLMVAAGMQVSAKEDDSFFTHLHTDKAMANVTVSPGRCGSGRYSDADKVDVEAPILVK
jgi:copper transport protein